jgi:nucleotide-binding universal stress UspA family protein
MHVDRGYERMQKVIRTEVAAMAYLETRRAPQATGPNPADAIATQGAPPRPVTIIVGVDESDPSVDAVAWAAVEAVRRGGRLVLLMVEEPHATLPPTGDEEEAARGRLSALTDSVQSAHPHPDDVVMELLPGVAGPTLVERARDADLLVVGSRGRGAVARSLLGSVSTHCVTHASCPTTVVPHDWSPPAGTIRQAGRGEAG